MSSPTNNSILKKQSYFDREVSVPLPPRPVEIGPDDLEDETYIESSPPALRANNFSQGSCLYTVHLQSRVNTTSTSPKIRKRSTVSFSDNVTIIPSQEKCEDQIEVEEREIVHESCFSKSEGDDTVPINETYELPIQNPELFDELSKQDLEHQGLPSSSISTRSTNSLNLEDIDISEYFEGDLKNQKQPMSPDYSDHVKKLKIVEKINISDNAEDIHVNEKEILKAEFCREETALSKENQRELKSINALKLPKSPTSNVYSSYFSKNVEGDSGNSISSQKYTRSSYLLSETNSFPHGVPSSDKKPLDYEAVLAPPIPPKSKFHTDNKEFQNGLAKELYSELTALSSITMKKRTKPPAVTKPSEPPPLPPKGIKNTKTFPGNPKQEIEQIDVNDINLNATNKPANIKKEEDIFEQNREGHQRDLDYGMVLDQMSQLPQYINNHAPFPTKGLSRELASIIDDLYNSEQEYVNQLQMCLQIERQLRTEGILEATLNKFFGLLHDVYLFHKRIFLADLDRHDGTTKYTPLCFLKHFINIDMYIQRQWLVPNECDLDQFECFLLDSRRVRNYLNITKTRVKEYIKKLHPYKIVCEEQDTESHKITERAIRVIENLLYQLEMIEQFKKIENIDNKFKKCGKVHLNCTFEILIKGNKKDIYLVYLCEKLIIFTCQQKNGTYRYVDDIPTSKIYCTIRKKKPKVIEIGAHDKKDFVMKADTETIKNQWCEKLRGILRSDQFCEK